MKLYGIENLLQNNLFFNGNWLEAEVKQSDKYCKWVLAILEFILSIFICV